MRTLLAFLISASATLAASFDLPMQFRPSTNAPYWLPGIPGGVTSYPIWTNVVSAGMDNTGVVPGDTILSNLNANCPGFRSIYFPPGVYNITNNVHVRRAAIEYLGAGEQFTTIKPAGPSMQDTHGLFYFKAAGFGTANLLSSGYNRGSSNLVCFTVTGLSLGSYVLVYETNDPAWNFGPVAHGELKGQFNQITAISGTNVTLLRPLYAPYSSPFFPTIKSISSPQTNSGVTGIRIDLSNISSGLNDGIWLYRSVDCWVRDCTVTNTPFTGVKVQYSFRPEIRGCRLGYSQTQNSSRYGVELAYNTTDGLVEDNIYEWTSAGVQIQLGASGNVVGYNFFGRSYTGFTACLAASWLLHGDSPSHNLYVRNKGPGAQSDDVWGGNLYNTWLNNDLSASNLYTNYPSGCRICYREEFSNPSNAFVGNFLMRPIDSGAATNGSFHPIETETSTNNTYFHANVDRNNGVITYPGGVTNTIDSDFYHTSKPRFLGPIPWMFEPAYWNTNRHATNVFFNAAEARYRAQPDLIKLQ